MTRALRTLAAVLAGVALVAALPAPCGCAPERTTPRPAGEHACCAPPDGVSATAGSCCDERPDAAEAVPSSGVFASVLVAVPVPRAAVPSAATALPPPAHVATASPPPPVLRI